MWLTNFGPTSTCSSDHTDEDRKLGPITMSLLRRIGSKTVAFPKATRFDCLTQSHLSN